MIRNGAIILTTALVCLTACHKPGGPGEKGSLSGQVPEKVIFDTDMGSDCDDAGALALLHEYATEGRAEILGVIYSSGRVPYGVGVIDAINTFYGRSHIPIGAAQDTLVGDPVDKMLAEKLARDTCAYGHSLIHNHDVEDQAALSRRLLSLQPDKSVTYITVGHTKGLYDLLVSGPDTISSLDGAELLRKKVKRWVAMGALFATDPEKGHRPDWNFFYNGAGNYTPYLLENFPCPMYFIADGTEVMTGKSLAYTIPGNIVRDAYGHWLWNYFQETLFEQRPSWDLCAVYYAIEGKGKFLKELESGHLDVHPEKGGLWIPGEKSGRQHIFVLEEGVEQEFGDYLNDMISRQGTRGSIPVR